MQFTFETPPGLKPVVLCGFFGTAEAGPLTQGGGFSFVVPTLPHRSRKDRAPGTWDTRPRS